MGIKRPAEDIDGMDIRSRCPNPKRRKATTSPEKDYDSSEQSSCSVSEDSALQSSPHVSDHEQASSLSSLQSPVSDDDSASSLHDSESSTASDPSTDDDEDIITIGGPKKPRMTRIDFNERACDLRTRLDSLLPQLAASNDLLVSSDGHLNMEDVEDGEQHIEMNLGLGVLKERRSDESESESECSSGEDGEENHDESGLLSSDATQQAQHDARSDVMRKLLGWSEERRRPGIEDMG